jgi:hypothetical protein
LKKGIRVLLFVGLEYSQGRPFLPELGLAGLGLGLTFLQALRLFALSGLAWDALLISTSNNLIQARTNHTSLIGISKNAIFRLYLMEHEFML